MIVSSVVHHICCYNKNTNKILTILLEYFMMSYVYTVPLPVFRVYVTRKYVAFLPIIEESQFSYLSNKSGNVIYKYVRTQSRMEKQLIANSWIIIKFVSGSNTFISTRECWGSYIWSRTVVNISIYRASFTLCIYNSDKT